MYTEICIDTFHTGYFN